MLRRRAGTLQNDLAAGARSNLFHLYLFRRKSALRKSRIAAGNHAAIKSVVDEFVANVGAGTRINKYFANANLDRLKGHLVNQIGEASGGPQQYTGRDMKTAHAGMGIDEPAFNALVEDLVKALDKFSVPEQEKSELLAVLGPMKSDIVEK